MPHELNPPREQEKENEQINILRTIHFPLITSAQMANKI